MGILKRREITCLVVLFAAVCAVALVLPCIRPISVQYRSVASNGPHASEEGKDWCWGDHRFYLTPPEYLIRDGQLFLRTQSQHNLIVLLGAVDDDWDASRIVAFRRAHPDLEAYWPDKDRVDGGVKWLRTK